jgi:NDP-sugar pyrophosphorylase family protein
VTLISWCSIRSLPVDAIFTRLSAETVTVARASSPFASQGPDRRTTATGLSEERPAAILSVRYFRDPASGGAVYLDGDRVTRIVERPKPGETTTHYINAGIFVFPPAIFDLLRQVDLSPRGEYELTDAIRMLIERGETVRAYDLEGFWINVTDPASYLEAQRALLAEMDCPPPDVPEGVTVQEPVVIGAGGSLAACEVGPNVSLGDGCTVGEDAALRDAIVMAGATIGPGAVLDGAVVGLGATVGQAARLVARSDGVAAMVLHGGRV